MGQFSPHLVVDFPNKVSKAILGALSSQVIFVLCRFYDHMSKHVSQCLGTSGLELFPRAAEPLSEVSSIS